MQVDGSIVERERQQLQVVVQGLQRRCHLDGWGRVHLAPQGGVRGVLALHRVMADELEGELIVVDELLCRQGERRLQRSTALIASNAGRLAARLLTRSRWTPRGWLLVEGERREERPVETHLQMAYRRDEA